jgi:hypothetical protein
VSTTTIVLIIVAIAIIAAIAYFALRGRPDAVAVAAADDEDPAFSATGEAMIVGDVMPIDSNEPSIPAGTAQPPTADAEWRSLRQAQTDTMRDAQGPSDAGAVQRLSDGDLAQCQSELVEDCATQRAEIRWPKRFVPREGALDDATRLTLLRDLGIVRAPWGVPLLAQAFEEEPAVEHRRAALRALAAYRHPDAQPTFELALRADDEETRAIAANALSALQIRAALPS